ncbi:MAG: MFS transporter [Candidatus Aramenus sulfurataquae]|jgi:MFS family permease|uniref:MFS transporter n=4 Tax=Candidatus Aramenus sulfurataquae TaxID=1326980 RepID=A0AAE3FJ31_9CREN|nr:MFS transporter [Candidatus Aramenus sulfurataquae]
MPMKGKTIYLARVVYSISWFYLSPEIPYILSKYNVSSSLAGFIPFSFFIGSGTMQLPSAFISTKIGLRNSMTLGLLIMSISAFLVSTSSTFFQVVLFYFLGGVGASLFFSSGGALLAELNKDKLGRVMGLYNASFSLGGIIGLNWVFLDQLLGFKFATTLLSAITLLSAFTNLRLPNYFPNWEVIRNVKVLYFGIATSGVWGVYYVVGELFPTFAHEYLHVSDVEGGVVTSLLLVSSLVGGLLGFLGDRGNKVKLLLFSSVMGVLPSLLLYTNLYVIGIVTLGVFNELAISILYSIVAVETKGLNSSVGLAEVNSLNIVLGTWLEPLASFSGHLAWVIVDVAALLPLLVVFKAIRTY